MNFASLQGEVHLVKRNNARKPLYNLYTLQILLFHGTTSENRFTKSNLKIHDPKGLNYNTGIVSSGLSVIFAKGITGDCGTAIGFFASERCLLFV